MYRFELADNTTTSVNYRQLSSTYTKSKIYCLLFVCSAILSFVVYVLVKFMTETSYFTSDSSSRYQLIFPENVSDSNYYETAKQNTVKVPLLTTPKLPTKISFRRIKINLVNNTDEREESPLEPTSSRTLPLNSSETHSQPGEPSTFTHESITTTFDTPVPVTQFLPTSSKPNQLISSSFDPVGSQDNNTLQCGVRSVEQPSSGRSSDINTYFGEFPWMLVLLYLNHSSENAFKCGASLIAPDVALTAAHCVKSQYGVQYIVRAGDWYLDGTLKREFLPPQEREVVNIEVHPSFSSKTLENNIALLKLASNFVYDDHIRPICLPDWNSHYDPGNCVVIGWGKDSAEDTTHHEFLRQVGLKLVPTDECETKLRSSILGKYYQLSSGELCASNASSSVASCKGDGGGPLLCPSTSMSDLYYQVGVSTWNVQCDPNIPGLYTNVEFHLDWLDKIMAKFQEAPLQKIEEDLSDVAVNPDEERRG